MKNTFFMFFISIALGISLNTSAASYYKWVDDSGVTHYGSTPPTQKDATKITVNSNASSSSKGDVDRLNKTRADLEQTIKQREQNASTPQTTTDKKNAAIIAKNCELYRNNLTVMTQNSRIKEESDTGETVILPEETRQSRIKAAKDYINKHCS